MKYFLFLAVMLTALISCNTHEKKSKPEIIVERPAEPEIYHAPDTNDLKDDEWGRLVRYGARLIRHTSYFLGPDGTVSKQLGNKMNCTNCHLDAGTKPY